MGIWEKRWGEGQGESHSGDRVWNVLNAILRSWEALTGVENR